MWRATAPTLDPARLVFLDESGVRTDLVRRYGRGRRGERVPDHAPDGRWHSTTFLAALRVTGVTAPAVFDGPIDGVAEAIPGAGAALWYLPPSSPDLNPIELSFAKLKTILRAARCRTVAHLWTTIGAALARVEPDECRNYFRHCGYAAATGSCNLL